MNWLRALVVVALCALPVSAVAWWQSVAQHSITVPPPSGLLLDTLSATARVAYATNKLRSAFAGAPVSAFNGTTNQNIPFDGSNNLDTTSLTTFCLALTCGMGTWYDQMGLADCTQGTSTGQARLYGGGAVDTFPNGRAAPRFGVISANTFCLVTQSNVAQPNTIVMVVKHNSQVNSGHWTDGNTISPRSIVGVTGGPPPTAYQIFAGTGISGGTLDTSAHLLIAIFNGASCTLSVDGTVVIPAASCNTQGVTNFVIGAGKGSGAAVGSDGPIGMFLLFNSAISPGDQSLILAYSQTTWGTP